MAHGDVRHKSPVAVVLVDIVNHFEFPDGDRILRNAMPIFPNLARLKKRARQANIPVIYVNDNFGQWRSDAAKVLAYCLLRGADDHRAQPGDRTHPRDGGREGAAVQLVAIRKAPAITG